MKNWLLAVLTSIVMILAGCTATTYGVPRERWETLSEAERIAAMDAYRAHQAVLQERLREQARQRAVAEQAQLARAAEEARQQQLQIDAIYRGEGTYGDLLRVTIRDGMLKFKGAHQAYHPVSFKLAAGEAKEIQVVSHNGRRATLFASYDGGNLLLDESSSSHRSLAANMVYDDAWGQGKTYPGLSSKGPLELRGVNATIDIVGTPPMERQARKHPRVTIIKRPVQKPETPPMIVIKGQPQPEKPPVMIIKEQPHPKKPPVIVVKEKPHSEKLPVVVVKQQPQPKKTPMVVAKKKPQPGKPPVGVTENPRGIVPGPTAQKSPDSAADDRRLTGKKTGEFEKPAPVRVKKPAGKAGPPTTVNITFQRGKIKTRGESSPLVPQSVVMNEGEIRTITLRGSKGALKLQVSYLAGEIQLDDQPGKKGNKTKLGYDPGWVTGHTYRIGETDSERLEDLDILIHAK